MFFIFLFNAIFAMNQNDKCQICQDDLTVEVETIEYVQLLLATAISEALIVEEENLIQFQSVHKDERDVMLSVDEIENQSKLGDFSFEGFNDAMVYFESVDDIENQFELEDLSFADFSSLSVCEWEKAEKKQRETTEFIEEMRKKETTDKTQNFQTCHFVWSSCILSDKYALTPRADEISWDSCQCPAVDYMEKVLWKWTKTGYEIGSGTFGQVFTMPATDNMIEPLNRAVKIIRCQKFDKGELNPELCRNDMEVEVWTQAKTFDFIQKTHSDFPKIKVPNLSTNIIKCEHGDCAFAKDGEFFHAFVMEKIENGECLIDVLDNNKINKKKREFLANEFPTQMLNFILAKRADKSIRNFPDIKDENIVLGTIGEDVVAYMIDFDLSAGTLGFCPDHQWKSETVGVKMSSGKVVETEVVKCSELVGLKFLLINLCLRLFKSRDNYVEVRDHLYNFYQISEGHEKLFQPRKDYEEFAKDKLAYQINFLKIQEDKCITQENIKQSHSTIFENALAKLNKVIAKDSDPEIRRFSYKLY